MYNAPIALIDTMGSDLTVVNSARVSFAKHHDVLDASDEKLIGFLAKENHFSPFTHCIAQFRITMPLATARQWYKSRIGVEKDCGWNEVSRRYVDDKPEFFMPDQWRSRAATNKQGSDPNKPVTELVDGTDITAAVSSFYAVSAQLYQELLDAGVAPEQARFVLPTALLTSWYETGSLMAYARMMKLRADAHAQRELLPYCQLIHEEMSKAFPISWSALMKSEIA